MTDGTSTKRDVDQGRVTKRQVVKLPVATSSARTPRKPAGKALPTAVPAKRDAPYRVGTPKLLSIGNPRIVKGYGKAPHRPTSQRCRAGRARSGAGLEALVVSTVLGMHEAVRWNALLYGTNGETWFLSFHCFTKYIKVTFFRGQALGPILPVEFKSRDTHYFHCYEGGQGDKD